MYFIQNVSAMLGSGQVPGFVVHFDFDSIYNYNKYSDNLRPFANQCFFFTFWQHNKIETNGNLYVHLDVASVANVP